MDGGNAGERAADGKDRNSFLFPAAKSIQTSDLSQIAARS
jgi:hypothetical protein